MYSLPKILQQPDKPSTLKETRLNKAHPGDGFKNQYADALTAAAYFMGSIPPSVHPSASSGKQGYLHCYACEHPVDASGKTIDEDYITKYRIRYFDQQEGDSLRAYLQ